MSNTATLLVGSFHTHLQLLELDVASSSLSLHTVSTPDFATYTWITASLQHKDLFYAAQAAPDASEGKISVVRVKNTQPYQLEILQDVGSGGVDPCHVGVSEAQIAIANYDSSTVCIYDIAEDGLLQESSANIMDLAKAERFTPGPDTARQEAPHPHMCYPSPDGDFIVPDLGADKLRYIKSGKNLPSHPGAGPRHVAVHPSGEYIYAVNELDNTVTVHSASGNPALPKCRESVLPSDLSVPKEHTMNAAAILLSSNSRFLYITNRLEGNPKGDSLVWFAVSADGSKVERKGELRTGLDHPRGAALFKHQGQEYLVTGSKTQKGAVVYKIDAQSGDVDKVARNDTVQHPSCFVLLQ